MCAQQLIINSDITYICSFSWQIKHITTVHSSSKISHSVWLLCIFQAYLSFLRYVDSKPESSLINSKWDLTIASYNLQRYNQLTPFLYNCVSSTFLCPVSIHCYTQVLLFYPVFIASHFKIIFIPVFLSPVCKRYFLRFLSHQSGSPQRIFHTLRSNT